MDRFASFTLVALLCISGCGPNNTPTPSSPAPAADASAAQNASATDIVSQFLDEIRRGGQDSRAHQLLTQKAQSELKRIGRTVQPIGSPDARFQVTRAEAVPDQPNSALVQSIWTEPSENGTSRDYEVVWAVERQDGDWRISGLVMDVAQDQSPIVIDFENGEMMAKLLASEDSAQPQSAQNADPQTNLDTGVADSPAITNPNTNSRAAANNPNLSR